MMEIEYKFDSIPSTNAIIDLYRSSGINRPITDTERIAKMYRNSNLVVSAWINGELVGIARSLTDFCYSCYLSDLAVNKEYQHQGIGKKLIELTQEKISPESMLLLLSAPAAMGYYPKIGLQKVENGFIIKRER
ncbi:MAG TPA: GNAT family N-acetyltransferase [Pelobium sp.]|jgi:ribosomal protein S18 acetylase RimI-like enzyme|nr:GNAT family N-acetyltransferase [Pelobium sp.]